MPQSSNLCSPELPDPRVEVIRIIWNNGKYSSNEWVLHHRQFVSALSRWPIRFLGLARCTLSHTIIVFSNTLFGKSFLTSLGTLLGRDSSVDIATRYGLGDTGIESLWRRISRTRTDRPWVPPTLLYNGYRVFPVGKPVGAWRWPTTLSSAEVKQGVEHTSTPPLGLRGLF